MADPLVAGLSVGDKIAGKYEVRGLIGRGGMGAVLRAYHDDLDEEFAIKVLSADVLRAAGMRKRFQREARSAAKIKSEHIARVFDTGTLDGDTPYLVMELLDGSDLSQRLQKRGRLSVEDIARFVMQAAEAVAEAHCLEIVHRDLKPENLFVSRRRDGSETIKVLDFGISKSLSRDAQAMTTQSSALGSPIYMSPEQLQTPMDVDTRTDIWSLGATMYELATGTPPFIADTLPALALKIVHGELDAFSTRNAPPSPTLEAVIAKCMAKDPAHRYTSIAAMVEDLAELCPTQGKLSTRRTKTLLTVSGPREPETFESTLLLSDEGDAADEIEAGRAAVARAEKAAVKTVAWEGGGPPLAEETGASSTQVSAVSRSTRADFAVTQAPEGASKRHIWLGLIAAALVLGVGAAWIRMTETTPASSPTSLPSLAAPPPSATAAEPQPTASEMPAPTHPPVAEPTVDNTTETPPAASFAPPPVPSTRPVRPQPPKPLQPAPRPPAPPPTASTNLYDTWKN